jgi:hypothetical protein
MEQQKLPNSTAIIVLAIFSFVCCCVYGSGIIPAIIALVLAGGSQKIYNADPQSYSNIGIIKIGKIVVIIGLVLNIIVIGLSIWMISALGWDTLMTNDPVLIQEKMNELLGK